MLEGAAQGTPILSSPGGETLNVPRKRDLRRVDSIAREFGIDRDEFGAYLEDCKAHGDRGTENDRGDFTMDELREKAREFLGE